jgi:hypothetical protein
MHLYNIKKTLYIYYKATYLSINHRRVESIDILKLTKNFLIVY